MQCGQLCFGAVQAWLCRLRGCVVMQCSTQAGRTVRQQFSGLASVAGATPTVKLGPPPVSPQRWGSAQEAKQQEGTWEAHGMAPCTLAAADISGNTCRRHCCARALCGVCNAQSSMHRAKQVVLIPTLSRSTTLCLHGGRASGAAWSRAGLGVVCMHWVSLEHGGAGRGTACTANQARPA